ncbi:MAG: response regulator, partial [Calditrichaeota bacterium]
MAQEKLLLIDDDPYHLQLLQQVFQRDAYSVSIARSAAEAILRLNQDVPDLIILDLILPDMDGYTLLETIKATPEWRFIPVIIVSSKQNLEDKLRGLRLGVMDYLTKPFER